MSDYSTFPPPHELAAYLEFIDRVIINARVMGWQNAPHEHIADLMDAVHNLPYYLSRWPEFDRDVFRVFLKGYDAKWPAGIRLLNVLDDCLMRASADP
jgi:hypothetical protein